MASVKRVVHKNGRVVYRIVVCLGYDKKGNKLVKNMTYSVNQSATPKQQEREAENYARSIEDKIKYGHDFDAEKMTFEEFAEKWLESIKSELEYSTYESYLQLLKNRILPYFKSYKMVNIKTPLIEAFYRTLVNDYSHGTVVKHANVLSGMFRTAIRWGMLEINPCRNAKMPKNNDEEHDIKYLTPQQSLMFLRSLDMVYETVYKGHRRVDDTGKMYYVNDYTESHKVDTQYKVFYTLSLFCGFRKGETLALHWDDIDFEKKEISISKAVGKVEKGVALKKPKTVTSVRKVPFPKQVTPLLMQYKKEYNLMRFRLGSEWKGDGNLFVREDGQLMGRSTPYQYFKRHLKRYNQWVKDNPIKAQEQGLEELPIIPLHGLRHSCATLLNYLEVNIVDISKYLGHAKSSTTMDIYAHSFEEQKREATNKLEEFLAKRA